MNDTKAGPTVGSVHALNADVCPHCNAKKDESHDGNCVFVRCPHCGAGNATNGCCDSGGPMVTTWPGTRASHLYHGTALKNLDSILKCGLRPRGSRRSNWVDQPSRTDCVYLSTNQGFTAGGSHGSDQVVVFEIPFKRLDFRRLLPDEDFIADFLAKNDGQGKLYHDLVGPVRRKLKGYRHHWGDSLCLWARWLIKDGYALIRSAGTASLITESGYSFRVVRLSRRCFNSVPTGKNMT